MTEPGRELAPDAEVRHEDWGGLSLAARTLTRVAFVEVDLTEVVTEGTVFEECTFRGVRFNVSEHRGSAFLNCVFTRCSFFDSTFTGCKLVGSRFADCSLDLLTVDGGDWSFVTLRDLDLSGADLSRADLTGCDLRGSDLSSVDPREVVLRDAIVTPLQAVVLAGALGVDVRPD